MDEDAAHAEIRRAAQETLDAWPEARAAVLFGSRARGNHQPDSDWDVAFIVKGDGERLGMVPNGLPFRRLDIGQCVNEVAIPERLVEREALCIGHVGHGIMRDGEVLAGRWHRPSVTGRPFMKAENYVRFMDASINMIRNAIGESFEIGAFDDWRSAPAKVDSFVALTADASEHLAKAMLGRHGIDAKAVHDVSELAAQARKAGDESLADDMIRMNGWTRGDHVARYQSSNAERLGHAIGRLLVVIDLLERELGAIQEDFIDAKTRSGLVRTAINALSRGAFVLRDAVKRDGADVAPPDPHGWLKPMLDLRTELPPKIEETADRLEKLPEGSVKNDWAPPELPPFDDPTGPFQT